MLDCQRTSRVKCAREAGSTSHERRGSTDSCFRPERHGGPALLVRSSCSSAELMTSATTTSSSPSTDRRFALIARVAVAAVRVLFPASWASAGASRPVVTPNRMQCEILRVALPAAAEAGDLSPTSIQRGAATRRNAAFIASGSDLVAGTQHGDLIAGTGYFNLANISASTGSSPARS